MCYQSEGTHSNSRGHRWTLSSGVKGILIAFFESIARFWMYTISSASCIRLLGKLPLLHLAFRRHCRRADKIIIKKFTSNPPLGISLLFQFLDGPEDTQNATSFDFLWAGELRGAGILPPESWEVPPLSRSFH
jgi:hypothetical protein